jgi:tRNA dimethylallyltransferase
MMRDPFQDVLVLTGPTGSGKSELALELVERLDAEIIALDSMTLYRGMDIGTAKPTAAEQRRVRHHLLDVLDPWESANVAWWLSRAADCTRDIQARGKRVLFVGGTALYLKALMYGLFSGPPADLALRQRLLDEAETAGPAVLHARLARIDPATAARLHPNDVRRVVRALEVNELTGRPLSTWQTQWRRAETHTEPASPQVLALDLPRRELYARIDTRLDHMMEAGLVDEVRALGALGRPLSREAMQALGYKEIFAYLDGGATLKETTERIKQRSRNFAKRQLTWFRHIPECRMVTRELTFAAWSLTMELGGWRRDPNRGT